MDLRDFVQRMSGSYPEESAATWAGALEVLPPDSQGRPLAVLEHLRTFPVAELILESARLRCPDPDTDAGHRRLREAMAAGVAVSRILTYLSRIEGLNQERVASPNARRGPTSSSTPISKRWGARWWSAIP